MTMILPLHAWVFTPNMLSGYQASSSGRSPVSTQASSAAVVVPGQWLGPKRNRPISSTTTANSVQHLFNFCCGTCHAPELPYLPTVTEDDSSSRQFGMELTADQWQPWDFDPLNLSPQHFAVRFASRVDCRLQDCTLCLIV